MTMPKARFGARPFSYLSRTAGGDPSWTVGQRILWDTANTVGGIDIQPTLTGGNAGQVTLLPGSYKLEATLASTGTSHDEEWQWYNVTASQFIGIPGKGGKSGSTGWASNTLQPLAIALLEITSTTIVEVRVQVATGTEGNPQTLDTARAFAIVERLE